MKDSGRRKKIAKGSVAVRPSPSTREGRVSTGIICFLLVAIVWIVFGQTLGHEFVNFDDPQYVYENPKITNGLSLEGIGWAFTHVHSDNWHPLTTISHMLDCQLYGLQPWGHHLTNVLLHSAAAVVLFLALLELTAVRWPSAFVAALFAIHPLRVGSVAWVAERKDVLSGVFFMLTLWAYARYVRGGKAASGRYTTVIVLFALGLMCKPTLVTLPFVLLLLDYWPLRRLAPASSAKSARSTRGEGPVVSRQLPTKSLQDLVIEKVPLFVLSALSCVATLLAQERAVITIHQLTFGDRVGNAMISYVAYINQMFWPANLSVVYPYPVSGINGGQALLALVVLLVVSVVFFIWRSKHPFLLVGWLWFLGVLIPMIGIIQVGAQARADRYTYLAQVGLYILITWGAVELLGKWHGGRVALIAVGTLIVTVLTADSYFQASFWQNNETLWNQALAHTSANHIAENNLGNALMKKDQFDEAIVHFRKALEIYADYPEANNNLGYALASKRKWNDAITFYRNAMRVRPNYAKAHNNLAVSLVEVGKTDEALAQFNEALRIDRDSLEAHCNLAIVLLRLNRRDDAVAHLREALRIKPGDTEVIAQLRELGAER